MQRNDSDPNPPVPGWSVPPTRGPQPAAGGRARAAVMVGVVAAVLVVALGVTAAVLALRPDPEPTRVSAEAPAGSVAPDGAVALDAESDTEPGQAAAGSGSPEASDTVAPSSSPRVSATPGTAPPAQAPAPTSAAPATKAPVTKAPVTKAPVTKAPATKAPTKAPATKAPAKKAPEIDKAVAKSGTRGAGPCSAKLAAGYACLQTYGDIWWVYDTKADSHSAVVFWQVGDRSGQCANSMGNGKIGACNKNYPEGASGRARVCIMDWDTKQVHQCTAYFSFKTG